PVPIINSLKKSTRLRSKDRPTMHCMVGTEDMPLEQLAENIETVLTALVNRLERGRNNIASVYIKTTMGPAVKLEGW
ncbi:50S ribosomal protein L1, partial [candidate division WOR-3 bacterium]|nr:50S ribosomal protein L1 [candidate division WOR-3 bacterium]